MIQRMRSLSWAMVLCLPGCASYHSELVADVPIVSNRAVPIAMTVLQRDVSGEHCVAAQSARMPSLDTALEIAHSQVPEADALANASLLFMRRSGPPAEVCFVVNADAVRLGGE
ncbi:MAG: hypothetical protein M5U32_11010 [Myxococcota bacterium]|nr:hypothetical protein [Myxococcota bacterium]